MLISCFSTKLWSLQRLFTYLNHLIANTGIWFRYNHNNFTLKKQHNQFGSRISCIKSQFNLMENLMLETWAQKMALKSFTSEILGKSLNFSDPGSFIYKMVIKWWYIHCNIVISFVLLSNKYLWCASYAPGTVPRTRHTGTTLQMPGISTNR